MKLVFAEGDAGDVVRCGDGGYEDVEKTGRMGGTAREISSCAVEVGWFAKMKTGPKGGVTEGYLTPSCTDMGCEDLERRGGWYMTIFLRFEKERRRTRV